MNHPEQTALPLELDVEKFVGLTPWVLASEQMPPCDGWWKTRLKSSPNLRQPQRRFWVTMSENVPGMRWGFFSQPVHPDESDEEAALSCSKASAYGPNEIEWCGLKQPHPDMTTPQEEQS